MKKYYEIMEATAEVSYKDRFNIKEGVTIDRDDYDSILIEKFDTYEAAKEKLNEFKTKITEYNGTLGLYYLIKEYYIVDNTYDEDDEVIEYGEFQDFSEMKIKLIENSTDKVIGIFNNYKEVEEAEEDYYYNKAEEDDNSVYISFV